MINKEFHTYRPKDLIAKYETLIRDKESLTKEEREDLLYFITYLQHERLIHLIVTAATGFVFFMTALVMFIFNNPFVYILFGAVTVLTACYISYYCYMENKTQYFEWKYAELKRKETKENDPE